MSKTDISRRKFLKLFGAGSLATAAAVSGCQQSGGSLDTADEYKNQVEPPKGKMTFRTDPHTKKQVSLLGYGMMRLPNLPGGKDGKETIDQEMVNRLVDYAI